MIFLFLFSYLSTSAFSGEYDGTKGNRFYDTVVYGFMMYECYIHDVNGRSAVVLNDGSQDFAWLAKIVATTVTKCSAEEKVAFLLGQKIALRCFLVCVSDCTASTGLGAIMYLSETYTEATETVESGGPQKIEYLSARHNTGADCLLSCEQKPLYPCSLRITNSNFSMNEVTNYNSGNRGVILLINHKTTFSDNTIVHNRNAYNGIIYGLSNDNRYKDLGEYKRSNFHNNYEQKLTIMYFLSCNVQLNELVFKSNTAWDNKMFYIRDGSLTFDNIYCTNLQYGEDDGTINAGNIHATEILFMLAHYASRACIASYPYPLRSATPPPTRSISSSQSITPFTTPLSTSKLNFHLIRIFSRYHAMF